MTEGKNLFAEENALTRTLRLARVAAGSEPADLVLKNASYLNVFTNSLCRGDIAVADGRIAGIGTYRGLGERDLSGSVVLPGLIDSHIHLESSLVTPAEFARAVVPHGTTTVVTDPHEIANILGESGIEYMLQATQGLPLDVQFMLPSCVPATPLDEAGAVLDRHSLEPFYGRSRVLGLAEMMNYVGITGGDRQAMEKVAAARARGLVVDGHAPGLSGPGLNAYAAVGISSDHECATLEEALEKISRGQVIMIREGTAARNLDALLPLLTPQYADRCLLCSDDKHPSDLLEKGHMDHICRRAIAGGADPIAAVKAATWNAARHFGMTDRGAVAPGYLADLTVVDSLESFRVRQVYKAGRAVYDGALLPFPEPAVAPELEARALDTFRVSPLTEADFRDARPRGIIGMVPGEIITRDMGYAQSVDLEKDILKIVVIERHRGTGHMGIGYLHGYGLKSGAVATSISHDSHNIICVGTNSRDMAFAVNRLVQCRGGIAVAENGALLGCVELPVGGIMSREPLEEVNRKLEAAKTAARRLGVTDGVDPFMTLSFMALPVIPQVRITTRGVVDAVTQQYL